MARQPLLAAGEAVSKQQERGCKGREVVREGTKQRLKEDKRS